MSRTVGEPHTVRAKLWMTETGTGRSASPGIKQLNVKGKDQGTRREWDNGKAETVGAIPALHREMLVSSSPVVV